MTDETKPKTKPKTETKNPIDMWREQGQVLENILRAYPTLTREQAIEELKTTGFY